MRRWLTNWLTRQRREARIPPRPFRACKRGAFIMYRLWYGRLSREQARPQTARWGFARPDIERMIGDATRPVEIIATDSASCGG